MASTITENQTARYKINAGGDEFTQREPKGLEFVAVEDHVDMIGICELTFSGGDDNASWAAMTPGSDVEVFAGGSDRPLFKGTISGLRHAFQKGKNTLTVIAMDPLMKMQGTRETLTYLEQKHSDIASTVISRSGCTVGVVDATSRVFDYVFQRNESDYSFVRRLAAENGYILMATEGKIDFKKPQFGGATEIPKDKVISMDYSFSPRDVPKEITAIGWDYNAKEKVEGKATSSDVQSIGGGSTAVDGTLFPGDATISDVWVDSQDSAKDLATAQLNRDARNFLKGRASVQGDAEFHAGQMIKFAGHPEGFNAEGFVLSSRHKIYVRGGFTTELIFSSNTMPQ